ncbi:MAG: ion transporter [Oscillospiraceae bacterium]|nr:ion transporter [Oscillospiraceae bacterium]
MRRMLFTIIEADDDNEPLSRLYDWGMMLVILLSMVPIAVKSTDGIYGIIELVSTVIFAIDYIFRLATADLKMNRGRLSFLLYPFTPMAIFDILAILPTILALSSSLRILKIFRLLRALRVFRVFKVIRYSKSIELILHVFRKQRESLLVVGGLAIGYILVSALVVISVEPDTFHTYFDAVYWAAISLTTVGYGDIYAVSTAGKVITIISSFFGIAIVALPAGIVTAGYLDALSHLQEQDGTAEDTEKQ